MFVHTVLFHLKKDLSADDLEAFEAGLDSLKAIEVSRGTYIGKPAETQERPAVRADYSYNLTLLFDTIEGHNAYQVHPLHKAFVNKFSDFWLRIEIIDAD